MHSIALLGGSGYLGSSLAKHLSKRLSVTVLDRIPPQDFDGSFKPCDIRDQQTLRESLIGFDLVINAAVIQLPRINEMKREAYEVNVLGVQNIVETVETTSSVKGLLHVSSWHVFGERDLSGVLDEEFGCHMSGCHMSELWSRQGFRGCMQGTYSLGFEFRVQQEDDIWIGKHPVHGIRHQLLPCISLQLSLRCCMPCQH